MKGRNRMHTFQLKLKELKQKIKKWNKVEFGNIHKEKNKLQGHMQQIQHQMILTGMTDDLIKEEGMILSKLKERRIQEEILWKRKYRIQWLREGEKNYSSFHKAMVQRRQHHWIFSLKDSEGNQVVEHQDMEKELVNHFKDILTEPNHNISVAIDRIKQFISKMVSREQNLALLREITMTEVKDIVKEMPRNKAPGPDGFTAEFYQASWQFLGKDIVELAEESVELVRYSLD